MLGIQEHLLFLVEWFCLEIVFKDNLQPSYVLQNYISHNVDVHAKRQKPLTGERDTSGSECCNYSKKLKETHTM